MTDKRVVKYIKECLLKGHSLDSIKKHLILHRHKETVINEAISTVSRDYEENKVRN